MKKVVITAAGIGTRLLPETKEHAKEMMPIFTSGSEGKMYVKPLLQVLFEQLFDFGIRNFCFIVGRGKRSIEDHFTPDDNLLSILEKDNKNGLYNEVVKFYDALKKVDITWKTQLRPNGFGDAVQKSKSFVQLDSFILFAGDDFVISENNDFLRRLIETHEQNNADATLVVQKVDDPHRYGVVFGEQLTDGCYKVNKIIEKPENPESNLAVVAVYVFTPEIFDALDKSGYDANGKKDLTGAIQILIEQGKRVYAEELKDNEIRLEIGTPESYKRTLDKSYEMLG